MQLEIQKGSKNKWSVNRLRELLNDYICTTERADQLCKSETIMGTSPTTGIAGSLKQPRQNYRQQSFAPCRYCKGNHWTDECMNFTTAEERKQRLKQSCFICLKPGHIAFECVVNKICFHCGRRSHHHRSLCPLKFSSEQQMYAQLTKHDYQKKIKYNPIRINKNQRSEEVMPSSHYANETEYKHKLTKLESLHKITHQGLKQVKVNLKESNIEMSRLKENISDIQLEQSNIQVTVTENDNTIQYQKQEIAKLKEQTVKLELAFRNLTKEIHVMQISEPETNKLKYESKDDEKDTVVCQRKENHKLEIRAEKSSKNITYNEDNTRNTNLGNEVSYPTAELHKFETLQLNFGQEIDTKTYPLMLRERLPVEFDALKIVSSNNQFAVCMKDLRHIYQFINRNDLILI